MGSITEDVNSYEGIDNVASNLSVGNKVSLFRRALLSRNIRVVTSQGGKTGNLPLWGAISNSDVKLFRGLMSAERGLSAHKLARDKTATKKILSEANVKVPRSYELKGSSAREDFAAIESLGLLPGVLKPNSGSHGVGVSMNIRDFGDFESALQDAGTAPIFEEQIEGRDYRLLTIGRSFFAATERKPAYVVGDGVSTVKELIVEKNRKRALNPSTKSHPIKLDDVALACLATQNVAINSVPPEGKEVRLRFVANIGAGGDSVNRTDEIHPEFMGISERIPELLGDPEILGIDLLAEDISRSPEDQQWAIIEINANPDIDLQHWPWQGQSLDAADRLAETYFPASAVGELLSAIIVIEGKVRVKDFDRWIAHNCALAGVEARPKYGKTQISLRVDGSQAAIDWFVEMLIRGKTGAIIRSISIE